MEVAGCFPEPCHSAFSVKALRFLNHTGIRLKGNAFYAACTKFMDDPVLGIILSTDDQEEERVILECAY